MATRFFILLYSLQKQPWLMLLILVAFLGACASTGVPDAAFMSDGDSLPMVTAAAGKRGPSAIYKGEKVSALQVDSIDSSIIAPDSQGGVAIISGKKAEPIPAGYTNARELKLKIRELAEQLIADVKEAPLQGTVAIPTSFVNLNAMDQTSSLGRLIAEQLIYEFNQRGFPVKEIRIPNHITSRKDEGEFYLTRAIAALAPKGAIVIAGTYHADKEAIFVNARLIAPSTGHVLRTANLVLNNNTMTKRLLRTTMKSSLPAGTIKITSNTANSLAIPATPFDQGADIH